MNAVSLWLQEWKQIFTNPKVLIKIVAILFVPILYAGMFLWSFWDPYGKLDHIPVAVVNMDMGAALDGKQIDAGQEVVDKLKENRVFDWHFVNDEQAWNGLKERKYYMLIEIPENFSANAATVLEENPKPLEIKYIPNQSMNFVSSQIGNSAIEKIKEEVAHSISKQYSEVVFDKVEQLSDGLSQAAEGSSKLSDGMVKVYNGTTEILSGMDEKRSSVLSLVNGSGKLMTGSEQLKKGLTDSLTGFTSVQDGADHLTQGTQQLQIGTNDLAKGLNELGKGANDVHNGTQQWVDGSSQVAAGMGKWQEGAGQWSNGSKQLHDGLMKVMEKYPELKNDPEFQALIASSSALSQNAEVLSAKSKELNDGIQTLAQSAVKLEQGTKQLADKTDEAAAGAKKLAGSTKTLTEGQQNLSQGISQLYKGQQQLYTGAGQLAEGTSQLSSGTKTLSAGWNRLAEGITQLKAGEEQVVEGSKELSTKLNDGAAQTQNVKTNENTIEMFSNPVQLTVDKFHNVPNYGTGFAPYILSLGLFVGALLLSIVFNMRKPSGTPTTGFGWFMSKLGTIVIIGIMQALIADVILLQGLGIHVEDVTRFIALSIVTSITFITLIQLLVTMMDDVGRFIAIIILVLQLTTSAGTFPLELIPPVLQKFNQWLPMTYSVAGFRTVISGMDNHFFLKNIRILFTYMGIFALLTWTFLEMKVRTRKTDFENA